MENIETLDVVQPEAGFITATDDQFIRDSIAAAADAEVKQDETDIGAEGLNEEATVH